MADVAALEFSDLIHSPFTQSPSPPLPDDDLNSELDDQPVDELELEHIRNTLKEMHYSSISKLSPIDPSNRERVLAAFVRMRLPVFLFTLSQYLYIQVLRLTRPGAPLASQVIQQAETIAQLSSHIEFISARHAHDRERWEGEREASARLTDAILSRARKDGVGRVEDLERENNTLLSDNRILQNRLQDTQSRLASLEAELVALRPYFLTKSEDSLQGPIHTSSLPYSRGQRTPRKSKERDGKNGSDEETTVDPYPLITRKHNAFKSPTTGDARIEHMLLAARKLGRERVARLAPPVALPTTGCNAFPGVFLPINAYVPPKPSTPQTPKSAASAAPLRAMPPGTPINKFSPGIGLLPKISPNPYMRPNAAANYAAATAAAHASTKAAPAANLVTSSSSLKATNPNGLESLLSAAKRVFDPDSPSNNANPSKKRRVEQQSNGTRQSGVNTKDAPTIPLSAGQAMSALDVLADQAAAFGTEDTDGLNSDDSDEPMGTNGRPSGSRTDAPRPSGSSNVSPIKKPKSSALSRSGSTTLPSYSNYLPDYKSMLSSGPLPPAPDYSSPFGPRLDAKGKGKTPSFPTVLSSRSNPATNPYTPRPSIASATSLTQPSPSPIKIQAATSGTTRTRNTPNSKPLVSYSALPLSATRSTSAVGPRESSARKTTPSSRSSDSRSSVSRSRSTSPIIMHRTLNGHSVRTSEPLAGQRRGLQKIGKLGLLLPKQITLDPSPSTSTAEIEYQQTTRPERTIVGTENFSLPLLP